MRLREATARERTPYACGGNKKRHRHPELHRLRPEHRDEEEQDPEDERSDGEPSKLLHTLNLRLTT